MVLYIVNGSLGLSRLKSANSSIELIVTVGSDSNDLYHDHAAGRIYCNHPINMYSDKQDAPGDYVFCASWVFGMITLVGWLMYPLALTFILSL